MILAVPAGHWHNVFFCETCQANTFWDNNSACGDPECCGENLDYCTVCGSNEWPRGADGALDAVLPVSVDRFG